MQAIYENHYLDDIAVANYARHSFAKLAENYSEKQNHGLIKFLARGVMGEKWEDLIDQMAGIQSKEEAHKLAVYLRSIPEHWVPFGHPHITLRMQAPVPIRTQCYKHKIGFVESEESRRYIKSTPVLYIPEHFRASAENVKQGSAGVHWDSDYWRERYIEEGKAAIQTYEEMVADKVAPEQARFILPQGCEVHWVWTGSLYAYAMAYVARSDDHAQKESQDLFAEIDAIIQPLFPVSWNALTRGEY